VDPKIEKLGVALTQLEAARLYRRRRVVRGQGVELEVDGRLCIGFCSNDYLGLAADPRVVEALRRGAVEYGVGSGASHLVCGHQHPHHALEEELAAFVGRPRALLFSTGYMANLGVVGALAGRGDVVFEDRLNHASLLDAGLLSGARLRRYPHADAGVLGAWLRDDAHRGGVIVTDGLFSMDGDLAPLPAIAALAGAHGAWLIVDDAHGLGVLGASGRGTLEHFGLGAAEVPVLVGTLGKAFGTSGAFVAGEEALIETLIQRARTYIYTTALPPALAEATRTSVRLVQEEGWRRERLHALITRLREGAAQLDLPLLPSDSPIQPLLVGEAGAALALSEALLEEGLLVSAIRPPTVPRNTARLRITLSAAHREAHVDRLLDALARLLKNFVR
jgi:8-amino-7-oxononanoate synthase